MEVIPYFLPDLPAQAETAPPHPRPYFLFVGRLEKIKGVQDIIPAFAGKEGPDLLIAGTGEYEQTLKDQAKGHPRVKFLGRLAPDALPAYYQHARALIVPSLCYETFGIIIIEAFRMGTPVLARRLGPFPEIVAKGGGLLFDGADELRAAIDAIQSDDTFREKFSRQARQAFEENWTDDIVLNRYFALISRVARERGMNDVSAAAEGSR
jgi:glycosyltransferase involved in cell wall biosynthesis